MKELPYIQGRFRDSVTKAAVKWILGNRFFCLVAFQNVLYIATFRINMLKDSRCFRGHVRFWLKVTLVNIGSYMYLYFYLAKVCVSYGMRSTGV